MKNNLPTYAYKILSYFLFDKDRDSILFSYGQLYSDLLSEKGKSNAQLWLLKEIIKSLPGLILSSIVWNLTMGKSYFKLAWRNLRRNKVSSIINIAGLSVSISISLVIFLWIIEIYDKDTFHEKADRIFTIYSIYQSGSDIDLYGTTPVPLGPLVTDELNQIEKSVRVKVERRKNLIYNNVNYRTDIFKVDEDFFELFDFELLKGNKDALSSKDAILITEEYAKRVFGNDDPINKQLIFSYSDNSKSSGKEIFSRKNVKNKSFGFTVRGIFKKNTKNTALTFDCIIPFNNIANGNSSANIDWSTTTSTTFVLLQDKNDKDIVTKQLQNYVQFSNTKNSPLQDKKIIEYELDNLVTMARNPADIRNGFNNSDNSLIFLYIRIFAALLILAIPSFNFINIAIANADMRLKEIGIRKVIGANISQLRKQFLTESLLLSLIAIVIGVLICDFIILPMWYEISVFSSNFILTTYLYNYRLWIILTSILLFTGLFAGAYPAFYVSKFKPVNILRRNINVKAQKRFTKVLVGTQFVLTFCLMAFTVIIGLQIDYVKNMDKGYKSDNIHSLYIRNNQRFNSLSNELAKNPNILNIAGTKNHIGVSVGVGDLKVLGEDTDIFHFDIGKNYFNTIGLRMLNGEGFNENLTSSNDIIINESFADRFPRMTNKKSILFNNETYNIVGTVNNFHFYSLTAEKIEPVLIRLIPDEEYSFVVFEIKDGTEKQVSEFIMKSWKNIFPGEAANEILEQSSLVTGIFSGFDNVIYLYRFLGIVIFTISCIGLFGLVSLHVSRRKKEISIHKVMGSSVKNILIMLNTEYLKILGVSLTIGILINYYAYDFLFSMITYHFEFSVLPLFLIAIAIMAITLSTVFYPVMKAATANPVDSLREE